MTYDWNEIFVSFVIRGSPGGTIYLVTSEVLYVDRDEWGIQLILLLLKMHMGDIHTTYSRSHGMQPLLAETESVNVS